MDKEVIKKYAQTVLKIGSNIQPNEEVVIAADACCHEFVAALADAAYELGAKKVTTLFSSEKVMKLRYLNESVETLTDIPDWVVKSREYAVEKDAAYISVVSDDPEAFADINSDKIAAYIKVIRTKLNKFYDATMKSDIRWTIVAYPSIEWAQKVFPNDNNAFEKLFDLIAKAMRLDAADPVQAWKEHQQQLKKRVEYLNAAKFKALKYKNSLGTDFYVELPENYIFMGGEEYSKGRIFTANMPTEEVFSAPSKLSAKGTLVASMPLIYNGARIEDFYLKFDQGKIVDYKAKVGHDVLKNIIETDEGSKYLGEVAIVPFDSPIQKMKTIFYETLFDENASCHFAIGKAYPCLKDAENMTKEDLDKAGINESLQHVDFMIGTKDLEITGITQDGKEIKFFKNGNFDIEL
ncbi:MAG TPA: aminopeptidase [Clostridia bacterium]